MNSKCFFNPLQSFLTHWKAWRTRRRAAYLFSVWRLDIEHAQFLYLDVHHFFGLPVQHPNLSADVFQNEFYNRDPHHLTVSHLVSAVFTQHFENGLGKQGTQSNIEIAALTPPVEVLFRVLNFVRAEFEHDFLTAVHSMAVGIVIGHLSHAEWLRKNQWQASRVDYNDISNQHPERKALRAFSFAVYSFLEVKGKELEDLSLNRAQAMSWLERFLEDLPEPPCSFPSIVSKNAFRILEIKLSLRRITEHALLSSNFSNADFEHSIEAL